ncbi:hypothetical protein C5167_016312 [Papaver somniferum]|nr:hypothetical protein C5167_016312 [Papaver somniferum]
MMRDKAAYEQRVKGFVILFIYPSIIYAYNLIQTSQTCSNHFRNTLNLYIHNAILFSELASLLQFIS